MHSNNTIIISAVNFVEGGPLSILKKCVEELLRFNAENQYKIYVLVHSKALLSEYNGIECIEYNKAKKNWLIRLYYEYFEFKHLSKKLKPKVWISLHDITPNVRVEYLYTYMHNPSPFYQKRKSAQLNWKFNLFVKFYKYLYKFNVKSNTAVIVQQNWFRDRIAELCCLPKEKIIVAYPEQNASDVLSYDGNYNKAQFFYNAFPRDFKNFEIICDACDILEKQRFDVDWNVYLTIDGTENNYSKQIVEKYKDNKHIHFIGLISRNKCEEYYRGSEALIFPSTLETWGLPISEFKMYGKKMILADLPYAHEASSDANLVSFFEPYNAQQLAEIMKNVICEKSESYFSYVPQLQIDSPFCSSWQDLFKLMKL